MIATRFKHVGYAAGVAAAALACYLVSLQVASERTQLMRAERAILAARADIRQLRTELDTRGRLVQLERWNADVLGLQAPKAQQYASGAVQLASFSAARALPQVIQAALPVAPAAPHVVTVAATPSVPRTVVAPSPVIPAVLPAPHGRPQVQTIAYRAPAAQKVVPVTKPRALPVQAAAFRPPVPDPQPAMLHKASWSPPVAAARPVRGSGDLLGADLLGDIGRKAKAEAKSAKAPK